MSNMLTMSFPHHPTRAESRRRSREQMDTLPSQARGVIASVEQTWTGDTLDFKVTAVGQSVTGQAAVEDQAVRLELTLPWILQMLAGGIRQQIEQKGREMLGHKKL